MIMIILNDTLIYWNELQKRNTKEKLWFSHIPLAPHLFCLEARFTGVQKTLVTSFLNLVTPLFSFLHHIHTILFFRSCHSLILVFLEPSSSVLFVALSITNQKPLSSRQTPSNIFPSNTSPLLFSYVSAQTSTQATEFFCQVLDQRDSLYPDTTTKGRLSLPHCEMRQTKGKTHNQPSVVASDLSFNGQSVRTGKTHTPNSRSCWGKQ